MKPGFGSELSNVLLRQSQIVHTRMAGMAVIRVVLRCNEAMADSNLNLSDCQLMQVPEAVYHLLRHTTLLSCNLAANNISKISPKFGTQFSRLTELNLSNNKLSRLPDEMLECVNLEKLDLGHNTFVDIPQVVLRFSKLRILLLNNNFIMDVDVRQLPEDSPIKEVDLRDNPLMPSCHETLSKVTTVTVTLSPREREEWEDLEI
uniref:Leucine-rich repeat-containing protein 20-like n=1 Tax=Hirondellea gigas TaxID=1518452 RepID=A0A2P2HWB6_9CRUS